MDIYFALDRDFKYTINYRTDGSNSCAESGCDEEGICRCYTIDSVNIKYVNFFEIKKTIFESMFSDKSKKVKRDNTITDILNEFGKDYLGYILCRLLRINKAWKTKNLDISYGSDYYGDEVYSINFNKTLIAKIADQYNEICNLDTLADKTRLLLYAEHPNLKGLYDNNKFRIDVINHKDIIFNNIIEPNNISAFTYAYKDYRTRHECDDILGICINDNGKYRIVDGYNTLSVNKLDKVKVIIIE